MSNVRYFNRKGRDEWANWLENLRKDPTLPFPADLLQRSDLTKAALGGATLPKAVESKYELAESLARPVSMIESKGLGIDQFPGLWDWLAAYYFDVLCPQKSDGTRILNELARYRWDPDYRRKYRHRIYGPVSLVRQLGEHAKVLLNGLPSTLTDWEEQAAARYETGGNPGIAEVLCMLYWDETTGRPKKGAAPNKKTPGTLRRFGDIMRQFALTYDLSAISAKGLLDLLPKEFNKWKPKTTE
jgi:hypothetical protein